ncbi:hypothetical protein HN873_060205 [Arachis hypogaea]
MSRASSSTLLLLQPFLQSEVFSKLSKNVTHPLAGNSSGDPRAKPSRKTIETEAHCKFFLWVDDHIVRVRAGEATRGSGDGKQNYVKEHLGMDNLIVLTWRKLAS